jgi:hypothetical protein
MYLIHACKLLIQLFACLHRADKPDTSMLGVSDVSGTGVDADSGVTRELTIKGMGKKHRHGLGRHTETC